jgi:ABC-type nitrate/sulfonate/bicarbonate transport system permease component
VKSGALSATKHGGPALGATLMYAQRFFESPTVFACIVAMLAVGLLFDKAMLMVRERLAVGRDEG